MSSLILVRDSAGRPLMPMAPAHARKLLNQGKARRQVHHAFTILQLTTQIVRPSVSPIVLAIQHDRLRSRFWVMSYSKASYLPLLYLQAEMLAHKPICSRSKKQSKQSAAASQALSLRFRSSVFSIITSLLPISSVHLFDIPPQPHFRRRSTQVVRRISNVPIQSSKPQRAAPGSPQVRQLQAFMQQPSIALTSCVVLPTKLFLNQHRLLCAMSQQILSIQHLVGIYENSLYVIESQLSNGWFPYWADHQHISWSQLAIPKDSIHPLHMDEPCAFIPIRTQGEQASSGEANKDDEP